LDPLFRTAARSYGTRVIGVILSGTLDDGAVGLHAIKSAGGIAVVQDPEQASYPGMPKSALARVQVDHVAPANELGALIDRLVRQPAPTRAFVPPTDQIDPADPDPAVLGNAGLRREEPRGRLSMLTCPECGGLLFEAEDGDLLHFRCHVGHAFSEETLLAMQSDALESALWGAVRALEEKAELARRLAERVRSRGMPRAAAGFGETAREAERGSAVIRETLLHGPVRSALEAPADPEPDQAEQSPSDRVAGLPTL